MQRTPEQIEKLVALADRVQQVLSGNTVAEVFEVALLVLSNAALQIDYTEEEFLADCAKGRRVSLEIQERKKELS